MRFSPRLQRPYEVVDVKEVQPTIMELETEGELLVSCVCTRQYLTKFLLGRYANYACE